MLYKNLIYKISVVLIIAVLLLSGCSFLPEITIDRPLQIDEDDYNRIIEAGDIQEELTDDNEYNRTGTGIKIDYNCGWGHNDAYAPGQGSDAT